MKRERGKKYFQLANRKLELQSNEKLFLEYITRTDS